MGRGMLGSARVPLALSGWDYLLRRPARTLFVVLMFGLFRFLGGRDMVKGGRTTDATFFRSAKRRHGSVWARMPGIGRLGVRCAVLVLLVLLVSGYSTLVIVVGSVWVCVVVYVGIKQVREERHLDAFVRPVWDAVAGIIGVDRDEAPSAWIDVPGPLETADDAITVGLRPADPDDDRRVAALVALFGQRLGFAVYGSIDYTQRLVYLRRRPVEPDVWPAVASVLGVSETELAADWLTVSPYVEDGTAPEDGDLRRDLRPAAAAERKQSATLVAQLPLSVTDHREIAAELAVLAGQRFGGEWMTRVDRVARTVTVFRTPPKKSPPKMVDFLAEHPDYRDVLAPDSGALPPASTALENAVTSNDDQDGVNR